MNTAAERVVQLLRRTAVTPDPIEAADAISEAIATIVAQPGTITPGQRDAMIEAGRVAIDHAMSLSTDVSGVFAEATIRAAGLCAEWWAVSPEQRAALDPVQVADTRDLAVLLRHRLAVAARLISLTRRTPIIEAPEPKPRTEFIPSPISREMH